MSSLARTALAVALVAAALPAAALAAQGPDQGSPFVDAPLPFEAIKAPPDSSFDILVASLGVFLLVPITGAAFMALARIRNLEASLRADLKDLRGAVEAAGAAKAGAGDGVDVAAALESLARSLEGREAGAGHGEADRVVAALEELRAAHDASAREMADRLQEALAALAARGAGGPSTGAAAASPTEATRAHLEALGYTDVTVVTPAEELTAERLADGAVIVEARREGATHKGKVLFKGGAPVEVQLQNGHGMFP